MKRYYILFFNFISLALVFATSYSFYVGYFSGIALENIFKKYENHFTPATSIFNAWILIQLVFCITMVYCIYLIMCNTLVKQLFTIACIFKAPNIKNFIIKFPFGFYSACLSLVLIVNATVFLKKNIFQLLLVNEFLITTLITIAYGIFYVSVLCKFKEISFGLAGVCGFIAIAYKNFIYH